MHNEGLLEDERWIKGWNIYIGYFEYGAYIYPSIYKYKIVCISINILNSKC
jgi:hypothetical protein